MREAGKFADGHAIIKATALLIGKSINIKVGTPQGENESAEHCFQFTADGVILTTDPKISAQVKADPNTIHLWLISYSIPHYELIGQPGPSVDPDNYAHSASTDRREAYNF